MSDKWWDDTNEWGHTVYFYDTEFRNRAISAHVWNRTEGAEGQTDTPFYPWEERQQLKFTGKQVEIDGNNYPVYRYDFFSYNFTPTNILFVVEKNGDAPSTNTADLTFTDGALYPLDAPAGFPGITDFDPQTLTDVDQSMRHTIYFANDHRYGYWSPDQLLVHVWGTAGDLRPYSLNESMSYSLSDEGKNRLGYYDNEYLEIFEYSFWYFGGHPTNLLFHQVSFPGYTSPYTGDLEFIDGALYGYKGNGKVTDPVVNPEIVDEIPRPTGAFYVADTDGWWKPGMTMPDYVNYNMMVSFNGQEFQYDINSQNDKEFGYKYININGHWYPLYKFNLIESRGKVASVKISNTSWGNRSTAFSPWKENGVYYFSGQDVSSEVKTIDDYEISDEIPREDIEASHKPATYYLNLGANQIMQEGLWDQPYCHPMRRPDTHPSDCATYQSPYGALYPEYVYDPVTGEYLGEQYKFNDPLADILPDYANRNEAEAMEMVAPGVWKYTIDDAAGCDDVLFYYYTPETPGSDNMVIAIHPASRSRYFNPTEWDEFVFDIGVDCVHQSYITPEEYLGILDTPLSQTKKLYISGTSAMSGLDGAKDPIDGVEVSVDHGCFFIEFEVTEEAPASFKLSTVDVAGIVKAKGIGDRYNFQRGWASYNLGIIGCHIDPEMEGYQEWYNSHVIRPEVGVSREIYFKTNESLDYNRYTQYPWRVDAGANGVAAPGKYWLVVDFLDEDRSVTLLDFDPHPHAVARPTGFRLIDVPADNAEEMHSGGYLDASTHNGKVLFDKVNVAKGEIDIEGTGAHLIEQEGFEVAYSLWLENEKALEMSGKPSSVKLDFMNLGDEASVAVRARFHDVKTGKYFSTRYSIGEIQRPAELFPAPEVAVEDKCLSGYSTNDGDPWTVAAVALVSYRNGESELKSYPDYTGHSASIGGAPAGEATFPLLHHLHPYTGYGWSHFTGMDADTPWTPWAEGEEYTAVNDWSSCIDREGKMSVLADNLTHTDHLPYQADCSFSLDIASVYPLLVRTGGFDLSPQYAHKSANADTGSGNEESGFPSDLSQFSLVNVRSASPLQVEIANTTISGIEEVKRGADLEAETEEIYDLSGKRVYGTPTPGIYIVKQGARVSKRIIR